MNIIVGDFIIALDTEGNTTAGGEVIEVDEFTVTVAQPYVYRHNGVIEEEGVTAHRLNRATHLFTEMEHEHRRILTGNQPLSAFTSESHAYRYAEENSRCVYGDAGECVFCFRSDH